MAGIDRPSAGSRASFPSVPDRASVQVSQGADPRDAYARTHAGSSPGFVVPGGVHKICPACGARYPDHFRACPQDGTALVDADEIVGTTVAGTYLITRILGEGGMGRVYEGRHARIPNRRFALKMLHPELAAQQAILTRFLREAEAVAAVQSPHVVDVFDVSQTADGRPCIISELLEGKELGDHLNAVGRMATGPAVRLVRQICKGLAAAHHKGVVHRDMKPENVYLTGDPAWPTAKIIDFGISKLEDKPALTQTGMIMGTPSYMSPEQARGERVDHRADIYAAGAILYRALTGKRPFDRDDPTATLVAVLSEDPPRPRSLNPDIPLDLEAVIQRAMAKAAADRYPTVDELDHALAPFDVGDPKAALGGDALTGRSTAVGGAPRVSARDAAEITWARPVLLLAWALGAGGLAAGAISAVVGALNAARAGERGGAPLTGSGAALLVLGVSIAVGGPAIVAAYHVRRRVWADDPKAIALARGVGTPVFLGLAAYGFASLLVRLIETVVLRAAVGVAWPVWDLLLFLIGLGAAAGVLVARWLSARWLERRA